MKAEILERSDIFNLVTSSQFARGGAEKQIGGFLICICYCKQPPGFIKDVRQLIFMFHRKHLWACSISILVPKGIQSK